MTPQSILAEGFSDKQQVKVRWQRTGIKAF